MYMLTGSLISFGTAVVRFLAVTYKAFNGYQSSQIFQVCEWGGQRENLSKSPWTVFFGLSLHKGGVDCCANQKTKWHWGNLHVFVNSWGGFFIWFFVASLSLPSIYLAFLLLLVFLLFLLLPIFMFLLFFPTLLTPTWLELWWPAFNKKNDSNFESANLKE